MSPPQAPETRSVTTAPVTATIPTRGRPERLKETLEKIIRCNPLPEEILILFDGEAESRTSIPDGCPIPVRTFHSETQLGARRIEKHPP